MSRKRSPLDPREQLAQAIGGRPVCPWCAPHFRAKITRQSSGDHTRCDDLYCGCHCQDPLKVN